MSVKLLAESFGISPRPKVVVKKERYTLQVYYRPKCWGPKEFLTEDRVVERSNLPKIIPSEIVAMAWKIVGSETWHPNKNVAGSYEITEIRYFKTTTKIVSVLKGADITPKAS